jgi:hypothetical protein
MIRKLAFDEVLEAVDRLSVDEQAELVHLVRRRLVERERERVVADVREARADRAAGRAQLLDLDEITKDLEP